MDAKTAWGIVFSIYIAAGLFPLGASAVGSRQGKLPDFLYKEKLEREGWKTTFPLTAWCAGLGLLFCAQALLANTSINAEGIFTISSIGAVIFISCSWAIFRQKASPSRGEKPAKERSKLIEKAPSENRKGLMVPNFNIWQRVIFGIGAFIVAVMISDNWDRYDDKIPAMGIALGVALAALAVAPKRAS